MNKLLFLGLVLFAFSARADSTAEQTQLGYLSTVGCPNGATVCFIPYDGTHPLPITLTITP